MLQKERWIYDPKRGLPRDIKDPQQSDQPLRNYDHSPVTVIVEETPTKKPRRGRVDLKRNITDDIHDDVVITEETVLPEKKRQRGKQQDKQPSSDSVFDVMDIDETPKNQKSSKPPLPPKGPPQVTPEDINLILDLKLEQMLGVISKNQTTIVRNFEKALETQKKEIMAATAAVTKSTVSTNASVGTSPQVDLQNHSPNAGLNYTPSAASAGLNFSPCGGLNFSPSSTLAGIVVYVHSFIDMKYNYMFVDQSGFNGIDSRRVGVYCNFVCVHVSNNFIILFYYSGYITHNPLQIYACSSNLSWKCSMQLEYAVSIPADAK